MNREEATTILAERVARYREHPYEHLAGLVGSSRVEAVTGASGTAYQLEYDFVWDGQPGSDVRVIGSIDDGGIRAFFPLSDGFIKAPDGHFVGE